VNKEFLCYPVASYAENKYNEERHVLGTAPMLSRGGMLIDRSLRISMGVDNFRKERYSLDWMAWYEIGFGRKEVCFLSRQETPTF